MAAFDFNSMFERAVSYHDLLARYGNDTQRARWQTLYDAVHLTDAQLTLLGGFQRRMQVLCLTGVWCGDCVNACPIFQRFAEATSWIDLRFVHRPARFDAQDGQPETALANELSICGGARVPVLVFLSEDGFECERFGERTLATYRDKVSKMQGLSCPIGPTAGVDLLQANVEEWLGHFERVQLMLLTSPRLLQLHAVAGG